MDTEKNRGKPGAGNPQSPQQQPEQNCIRRVQNNVCQMISGGPLQAPYLPLDPKTCEYERVILRCRPRLQPDSLQAGAIVKRYVFRQIAIVVPDEPRADRWQVVGQYRCDNDCNTRNGWGC